MKNHGKLGLYYLGATIADVRVLEKVRHANILTSSAMRVESGREELRECHITLLPPFFATYEQASALNFEIFKWKSRGHPVMDTQFMLGKLMTLFHENSVTFAFHVKTLVEGNPKVSFASYVRIMRQRACRIGGLIWRDNIPREFNPHISALALKDTAHPHVTIESLMANRGVQAVIISMNADSRNTPFLVATPTLYAKYETVGWKVLSQDPVAR